MSLLLDALKQAEQDKTKDVSLEKEKTNDEPGSAIGEEPVSQNPKISFNDDELELKSQLSKPLPFEIDDAQDQNAIDDFGDEFPFHHPKAFTVSDLKEDRDPVLDIPIEESVLAPSDSVKSHENIEDQPSLDILEKPADQPNSREPDTSSIERPFPPSDNEVIGRSETQDTKLAEDVLKVTRNSNWNRASVLVVGLATLVFAGAAGYFYLLEQLPKPVAMPSTGTFSSIENDSFGIGKTEQSDSILVDSGSSKIAKGDPQLKDQPVFRNKPDQIESPGTNAFSEPPVDFPEAIKIRKKRLRAETGRWLDTAYQSYLQNDYDSAEQYYLRVLERSPRNTDALLGLGSIAEKQGFAAKARRYYLKTLEQNPNNVYAKAALARKADKLSPTEKQSRLKSLIAEHPKSAGLYFSLGNQYAEQGYWAKAQAVYFQAATLEPQRPEYVLNLAVSMDHLGKSDVALQYYRKALGLAISKPARVDVARVENRIHQLTFK